MKWYVIEAVLILLFVSGVIGLAQDIPVLCGDLAAADCTLLQESSSAMQALESTTFTLESVVLLRDLPNLPVDSLEFNLNGQGNFGADMTSFLAMMTAETEPDMEMFFGAMADMLRGVNADITLSLTLPEDLSVMLPETDLPEQIALDFRMAEGVAYFNFEEIAALAPEAGIPASWLGIDLAELYGEIVPQQFRGEETGLLNMTALVQEFMKPENASKFMTIERLDDTEIMGQSMAVFHTRINYQNMLDIPALREMLEAQITASGESEEEVEEAVAMIGKIYQGMIFDVTQTIGLDDHLIHSTEWMFDWDLSHIPDLEAQGEPHFTVNMVIETTAFNADFQVDVPEGATLLPLKDMLRSE